MEPESTKGDLSAGIGDLSAGKGDLSAGKGDLSAGKGDLSAGKGDLSAERDAAISRCGDSASLRLASATSSRVR